jgi:hypothetical protein
MAYYPGTQPSGGQSLPGVGGAINARYAAMQQLQDDEKLRQFYASLLANGGTPGAAQAGVGAGVGPASAAGGAGGLAGQPMPWTTANRPAWQSGISNAGVNALLDSVWKSNAAKGAVGSGAGGGAGTDLSALAGQAGHGNIGKWAALLHAV